MWEELVGVGTWWDIPWCVGGNFNTVRYPTDRMGMDRLTPSM